MRNLKFLLLFSALLFIGCTSLMAGLGYKRDPDAVSIFDGISLGHVTADAGITATLVIINNFIRNMTRAKALATKVTKPDKKETV